MEIAEAQGDVRRVYAGGFFGQLVSAAVWLCAAAATTVASTAAGVVTLLAGGVLIFPVTTMLLKLTGRPASLPPRHPMNALAMQIAFTVPLGLLVAAAAAGYREEWFFPAAMIIVGAHYLPFTFLYGMPLFAVLAGVLSSGGVALAMVDLGSPSLGGWITGGVLIVFAFLLRRTNTADAAAPPDPFPTPQAR